MAAKPSRKPFVGGNWKCNGTVDSVSKLSDELKVIDTAGVDVMVSPIAIHIPLTQSKLSGTNIIVASQNCSATGMGAFTGEIAAEQLIDLKVNTTIIGHSERRAMFGDTDEIITKKVARALNNGLNVVACFGEKLEERKADKVEEVTSKQLKAIADGVDNNKKQWNNVVLAYEPVWAIGTGVACTADKAQATHAFLRKWLAENVSKEVAENTRIIYGGSVKPKNCVELFSQPDIDGFLVGGASLKGETFGPIIKSAQKK